MVGCLLPVCFYMHLIKLSYDWLCALCMLPVIFLSPLFDCALFVIAAAFLVCTLTTRTRSQALIAARSGSLQLLVI